MILPRATSPLWVLPDAPRVPPPALLTTCPVVAGASVPRLWVQVSASVMMPCLQSPTAACPAPGLGGREEGGAGGAGEGRREGVRAVVVVVLARVGAGFSSRVRVPVRGLPAGKLVLDAAHHRGRGVDEGVVYIQ
jgi:hypothetical protein